MTETLTRCPAVDASGARCALPVGHPDDHALFAPPRAARGGNQRLGAVLVGGVLAFVLAFVALVLAISLWPPAWYFEHSLSNSETGVGGLALAVVLWAPMSLAVRRLWDRKRLILVGLVVVVGLSIIIPVAYRSLPWATADRWSQVPTETSCAAWGHELNGAQRLNMAGELLGLAWAHFGIGDHPNRIYAGLFEYGISQECEGNDVKPVSAAAAQVFATYDFGGPR
jgi:uncharacterized membrane protein YhaH (DUF805 family)